jgi:glycerol-3-phosphate dehydrogenase (NAD(P)+)
MQFGIIGSGSWGTALAKVLTDNNHAVNWWIRNEQTIQHLQQRKHNPHYISSAYFNVDSLTMSNSIHYVIEQSDTIVIAVPATFIHDIFSALNKDIFTGKKIISAVKGIMPQTNELLHEYLQKNFNCSIHNYFTLLGPCHAEEIAAEKLSYLTFSGMDGQTAAHLSTFFKTPYLTILLNNDMPGAQYAAVLKNIYAIGAGIAHGLEYGDNFLSVFIANAAKEMISFISAIPQNAAPSFLQYLTSVYMGDLLVTCYSLYSRNRTFGNMIGKGYSVKVAALELNMVAEGYNASRCIYEINQHINAEIPIAETIYKILWENVKARTGFKQIEELLV